MLVWAAFQRHLLIFHDRFFAHKWRKICFYYLPPLLIIIYMVSFYIYSILLFPCGIPDYDDHDVCTIPCYFLDPLLSLWENILHGLVTTVLIMIFNGALLICVYRSKMRLRQSVNWRKYRKMIFQLVSISILYLSTNCPLFG